jgi:dihydrofolate reductase
VHRIEGYAIVSADGMIADSKGEMPDSLHFNADQHFLQSGLDGAAALIHGRHSSEGGPRAEQRKRLIVTRQIAAIAPDSTHAANTLLWNPSGATLDKALKELGAPDGTIAVIGGPEVFSMFLPLYDAFHLSRAAHVRIPGGLPVFTEVGPTATPEDVLARHGLKPGPRSDLDHDAGVTLVTWTR